MALEEEIVAQDAMTKRTVTRLTLPATAEEVDNFLMCRKAPTPVESLDSLMGGIKDWMQRRAQPDPSATIICRGPFWCYSPSEAEATIAEINRISNAGCGTVTFSRGHSFIEKANPPLSAEAGYARLYFDAWRAKQAYARGDMDEVYRYAVKIGAAEQELRMRAAFLGIVEKKKFEVETNRKNGRKGGQAEKKKERYDVLNRLAAESLKNFQYASDAQALRQARSLADKYDKGEAEPLFKMNGKPLSRSWFSDWLAQFREHLRGHQKFPLYDTTSSCRPYQHEIK